MRMESLAILCIAICSVCNVPFTLAELSSEDNRESVKEGRSEDDKTPKPSFQFSKDLETWEAPHEILKNYPYYLSGYDDEGRPIMVMEVGRWNYRNVIEAGGETLKNFEKHLEQAFYRMDFLARQWESRGASKGVIVIIDFEDFDISQMAHLSTVAHLLKWARQYRPFIMEHLHVGIGLNSNAVAHTLINFLRPIFGSILEKAEIYGTNKAKWIPHILKHCPKNQIAPWYGGSKDFVPVKVFG